MLTYQDFEQETNKGRFINNLITNHMSTETYSVAKDADLYDRQLNKTINEIVRVLYDLSGAAVENYVAANNKIASNFFHRLNTQRVTYSLGNGVSFTDHTEIIKDEDGTEHTVDRTKEKLGVKFDTDLYEVVYKGCIHGVSFGYWNSNRLYCFPVTQFVPLWDENNGSLRAGVRFWRLDSDKPLIAVLYEEDGFTKYQSKDGSDFKVIEPKKKYKTLTMSTTADGEWVVGEENYGSLPVIPFWGSKLKQSTLIGMKSAIDSFDLVRSGFANDMSDCSEIFWILENYGGMSDADLVKFRDKLKLMHIAQMDTQEGGKLSPYTQEVPTNARVQYLELIKQGIYEDFGALDVHQVNASSTNDHLEAAYQPLDENADDLEYQIIEFVQRVLALEGIKDTPVFKRNRISNQKEQTDMVMAVAEYLDEETVLRKLPFLTPDEVPAILARKDKQDQDRMIDGAVGALEDEEEEEGAVL